METRKIGQLDVSVIGLGGNNFGDRLDQERTTSVVNAALESGITYIDTADSYSAGKSEEFLGVALAGRFDQIVIATKFGSQGSADGKLSGGHPDHVRNACEASLKRLGVSVIDHYQYHRPDPNIPIEETMGAMTELVIEGKVREIGCSNFSVDQLETSSEIAKVKGWARFASVQNYYSIFTRDPEDGVVQACAQLGMALVPYFPLESGLLSGKVSSDGSAPEGSRLHQMKPAGRERFMGDKRLAAVEDLKAFAAERDHSILELAFAYLLSEPVVASVIAGATKPEQVEANAAASTWRLSPDERAEVARIASQADS
ncbi:MAG: aldo/keto reductase [Acidimicrobiia bacterium]